MAEKKKKYDCFEYRFEDIHGKNWVDEVNQIASEGWKISSFEKHSDANAWVVFERPILPDDDGPGLLGQTEAEREGLKPDDRAWMAPSTRERYVAGDDAPKPPTHAEQKDKNNAEKG